MEEFINIVAAVINTLDRVSVPVPFMEQIGIPVYNSANALKDVYKKMREKMDQESKKQPDAEIGEIEMVEMPLEAVKEDNTENIE